MCRPREAAAARNIAEQGGRGGTAVDTLALLDEEEYVVASQGVSQRTNHTKAKTTTFKAASRECPQL